MKETSMAGRGSYRSYPKRAEPRVEPELAVGCIPSGRYINIYLPYPQRELISAIKEKIGARYDKDRRVYLANGSEPDPNARRAGWQITADVARQYRDELISRGLPAVLLDAALKHAVTGTATAETKSSSTRARTEVKSPGDAKVAIVTVGSYGTLQLPLRKAASATEWITSGPALVQVGGQWQVWGLGLSHTVSFPSRALFAAGRIPVAVVGSAGRKDDAAKMTPELYERMIAAVHKVITEEWKLDPTKVELVSGAAAFADHVAVALAIDHPDQYTLRLFLPALWDEKKGRAYDNGLDDWKLNPGGQLNKYHEAFSTACGCDSLKELNDAITAGLAAVDDSAGGTMERNAMVAQAQYMVALTWGVGEPKPGGTARTWAQCTGTKKHIDLGTL